MAERSPPERAKIPTVNNRERVVAALEEVWAETGRLLDELADDEWSKPTPLPRWDVRDIVAHMIGTESALAGDPTPDVALDRDPALSALGENAEENERWLESMRTATPERMRERFSTITSRRLGSLRSLTAHEWDTSSFAPLPHFTYEMVMYTRVLDCWIHEQDIRDATGRPGHDSGLAVDCTLDAMGFSMGLVVGTNAEIEPGNSVTFALTQDGRVVREVNVEVGEEALVVPDLSGTATTTLTMPVGVWTRRCAGRVGPDALRDQIVIDGDAVIAERVLANQSYMP